MTPPKGDTLSDWKIFYEILGGCGSSINYDGEYSPKSNMVSGYSPKLFLLHIWPVGTKIKVDHFKVRDAVNKTKILLFQKDKERSEPPWTSQNWKSCIACIRREVWFTLQLISVTGLWHPKEFSQRSLEASQLLTLNSSYCWEENAPELPLPVQIKQVPFVICKVFWLG